MHSVSLGLVFLLVLTGCAFDNVGLLAAKVTPGDGAYVVDVYSIGAYLRTRPDDPGLLLGASRRSYVFSTTDETPPEPGWHYFFVPIPQKGTWTLDSRSFGVDVRAAVHDAGISLGYQETTILAEVPDSQSTAFVLSYSPDNPAAARLRLCDGEGRC